MNAEQIETLRHLAESLRSKAQEWRERRATKALNRANLDALAAHHDEQADAVEAALRKLLSPPTDGCAVCSRGGCGWCNPTEAEKRASSLDNA